MLWTGARAGWVQVGGRRRRTPAVRPRGGHLPQRISRTAVVTQHMLVPVAVAVTMPVPAALSAVACGRRRETCLSKAPQLRARVPRPALAPAPALALLRAATAVAMELQR